MKTFWVLTLLIALCLIGAFVVVACGDDDDDNDDEDSGNDDDSINDDDDDSSFDIGDECDDKSQCPSGAECCPTEETVEIPVCAAEVDCCDCFGAGYCEACEEGQQCEEDPTFPGEYFCSD